MRLITIIMSIFLLLIRPAVSFATRYTVEVKGNQSWTNTGVNLSNGDLVYTLAFGVVTYGSGSDIREILGPSGEAGNWSTGVQITGPKNCLIGKIGSSGSPFIIGGPLFEKEIAASGTLYLGINDDYTNDNLGSFLVDVFVNESGFSTFDSIVEVKTNQRWNDSGVYFSNGETATIISLGFGTYGSGSDPREALSPAGEAGNRSTGVYVTGSKNCLIGNIGSSTFIIGGPISVITAPVSGYLELGVNDDNVADNKGSHLVYIFKPVLNKVSEKDGRPCSFAIAQNFPNPFNPSTVIDYKVETPGVVIIDVFNVQGQKVNRLVNEYKNPGDYHKVWDGLMDNGLQAPAGSYYYQYRLNNSDKIMSKKMMLIR